MRARRVSFGLVVAVTTYAVFAGCTTTVLPPPTNLNVVDTVTLYAIHGTPITTPSAYLLNGPVLVYTAQTPTFDFAFDIDSTGTPVLQPFGALVKVRNDSLTQPGLLPTGSSFGAMTLAPTSGYGITQSVAVSVESVVLARSSAQICPDGLASALYAKLHVLALDPTRRTITFEILSDQNCGYVSLVPGLPQQ